MQRVYDNLTAPTLVEIDFSHLEEAENIHVWATSFLNMDLLPWQLDELTHVTNNLDTLEDYLMILGQRAGKSIAEAVLISYLLHKILMSNLVKNRGIRGWLGIALFNQSLKQAKSLSFEPLLNLIDNCLWFQLYHATLDFHRRTNHMGKLYDRTADYLAYYNLGIVVHPSDLDKREVRGNTNLIAVASEVSWWPREEDFPEDEPHNQLNNFDAVDAIANTLVTCRMSGVWRRFSLGVWSSSPQSMDPKIDALRWLRVALLPERTHVTHLATWEANPSIKKGARPLIAAWENDSEKFKRDFGAFKEFDDDVITPVGDEDDA